MKGERGSKAWPKVLVASVVVPPAGLVLAWLLPWTGGWSQRIASLIGRVAVSGSVAILTIVYAAMATFFMKVRAQEAVRQNVSSLFATHPPTEDRIRAAEQNIQSFLQPRAQYLVTTPEFQATKARLTELTVR
jgi:hypothetical protein